MNFNGESPQGGPEEAFERRTRELLRESAGGLDASVRSRLSRARAQAVESLQQRHARPAWGVLIPVGSLAAVGALAFLVWSATQDDQSPLMAQAPIVSEGEPQTPLDDLEILVASESFELLEELEFYESLDIDAGIPADIG